MAKMQAFAPTLPSSLLAASSPDVLSVEELELMEQIKRELKSPVLPTVETAKEQRAAEATAAKAALDQAKAEAAAAAFAASACCAFACSAASFAAFASAACCAFATSAAAFASAAAALA